MSQERIDPALVALIKATAQQMLLVCLPEASSYPLASLKLLPLGFLDQAMEQQYREALREHWLLQQA